MALIETIGMREDECEQTVSGPVVVTTFHEIWLMKFDIEDKSKYVLDNCGYPLYASRTDVPGCLVLGKKAKRLVNEKSGDTDNPYYLWELDITFGPMSPTDMGTGDNPANPLDWFPKISIEPDPEEEIVYEDVVDDGSGNFTPILNSAGCPYDPPLKRKRYRRIINIRKNVPGDFNFVSAFDDQEYVNASTWNGCPAGTVRAIPFRMPEVSYSQEVNMFYYELQYQFIYDKRGWKVPLVEQGYLSWDTTSSSLKQIIVDGQPTSEPVLLDADGAVLPLPVDPGDIVVREWEIYPSMDFSVFDLDDIFTLPEVPTV